MNKKYSLFISAILALTVNLAYSAHNKNVEYYAQRRLVLIEECSTKTATWIEQGAPDQSYEKTQYDAACKAVADNDVDWFNCIAEEQLKKQAHEAKENTENKQSPNKR